MSTNGNDKAKTDFLMSNRSHSGLMYNAGGAKSIWEPNYVQSIIPIQKQKSETGPQRQYFKK